VQPSSARPAVSFYSREDVSSSRLALVVTMYRAFLTQHDTGKAHTRAVLPAGVAGAGHAR
jgi:hypothetical protein